MKNLLTKLDLGGLVPFAIYALVFVAFAYLL